TAQAGPLRAPRCCAARSSCARFLWGGNRLQSIVVDLQNEANFYQLLQWLVETYSPTRRSSAPRLRPARPFAPASRSKRISAQCPNAAFEQAHAAVTLGPSRQPLPA